MQHSSINLEVYFRKVWKLLLRRLHHSDDIRVKSYVRIILGHPIGRCCTGDSDCLLWLSLQGCVASPPGLDKWFQRWRGLSLGGPRGKGSPSVSKGPKPSIQLLQLLNNSPREVKRAHFRYTYIGSPGSHPGDGIIGSRRGRSFPVPPVSPAMIATPRRPYYLAKSCITVKTRHQVFRECLNREWWGWSEGGAGSSHGVKGNGLGFRSADSGPKQAPVAVGEAQAAGASTVKTWVKGSWLNGTRNKRTNANPPPEGDRSAHNRLLVRPGRWPRTLTLGRERSRDRRRQVERRSRLSSGGEGAPKRPSGDRDRTVWGSATDVAFRFRYFCSGTTLLTLIGNGYRSWRTPKSSNCLSGAVQTIADQVLWLDQLQIENIIELNPDS